MLSFRPFLPSDFAEVSPEDKVFLFDTILLLLPETMVVWGDGETADAAASTLAATVSAAVIPAVAAVAPPPARIRFSSSAIASMVGATEGSLIITSAPSHPPGYSSPPPSAPNNEF